jgi:transcriptional regulator GlxA family with amidase domain
MVGLRFSDAAALRSAADSYLAVCFDQETPPRAGELAANLAVAAHQLTRTFQQLLRTSPSTYLKNGQVAHAKFLLSVTELSMNEIAYAAAFGTRMSFFRAFRRATGITPAQYRERHCCK